jgi:hypothetical protein
MKAIRNCPAKAGPQLGLLHVLTCNVDAAARLLTKAPGLGWSSEDHPGHVLFPIFAGLLADGNGATLSEDLFAGLQGIPHDPLGMDWDGGDAAKPKLATPSLATLIASVGPSRRIDFRGRLAMLGAMRAAATRRVEGILGKKRRRHYGHAAMLVACCLELAPVVGRQKAFSAWLTDMRKEFARFHAFQGELEVALASISPPSGWL